MSRISRRTFQKLAAGGAAAAALGVGGTQLATRPAVADRAVRRESPRDSLLRYARDTWECFVTMDDSDSGLPSGRVNVNGEIAVQTSTTGIGAYLWSAVVAVELGFISRGEATRRLRRTLTTLADLEYESSSGQYIQWLDHRTGEPLTRWPGEGHEITPHYSSVDNGWLATGLRVVANALPGLTNLARRIYQRMDFSLYYVEEENRMARTYEPSTGALPCCYNTLGEVRIAGWIGIGEGQIPAKHYFGPFRTFPDAGCEWGWQQMKPRGRWRNHLGVDVYEGVYSYQGRDFVPTWGGSMFEAIMVPMFIPEDDWGPRSWGINFPRYIQGQIDHGLREAEYGYWGFSPADVPEGGYKAYGTPWLGLNQNGYPSNNDDTFPDPGYDGCREAQPLPTAADYTNGVVTPHASALAARWRGAEVLSNLRKLERDFDIYSPLGFRDSVNVDTGVCADWYLILDQGLVLAGLGNLLAKDVLRRAFVTRDFERRLRPAVALEQFSFTDL